MVRYWLARRGGVGRLASLHARPLDGVARVTLWIPYGVMVTREPRCPALAELMLSSGEPHTNRSMGDTQLCVRVPRREGRSGRGHGQWA